jgi:dienelactone hydrolase
MQIHSTLLLRNMTRVTAHLIELLSKHPMAISACLFLPLLSAPTFAETIEAKLASGIVATADFHQGIPAQAAVLLIHGFLQTHHSPPISTLASNLASKGYTTLSPTISHGINRRKQSMPCEMVHTHFIHEDLTEVNYWVNWLAQKGYKNIVLIGFSSTGNVSVLLHNTQGAHPAVSKNILVSMNPVAISQAELKKARSANVASPEKNKKPNTYSVGYCRKNFVATLGSYLSYAQYHENHMLTLLTQNTVPTEFIFGTSDTILPRNWISQIKAIKPQSHLTIIEDANHFFDGKFEFDLAEKVEQSLNRHTIQ